MLDEDFSCMDNIKLYCNVKIEYTPKKRRPTFPILFLITLILNLAILNILISFTSAYSLAI
jgi:hypothetical protein